MTNCDVPRFVLSVLQIKIFPKRVHKVTVAGHLMVMQGFFPLHF